MRSLLFILMMTTSGFVFSMMSPSLALAGNQCDLIDCDCLFMDEATTTQSQRIKCLKKEKELQQSCKLALPTNAQVVPGKCDPTAQGPAAYPTALNLGTPPVAERIKNLTTLFENFPREQTLVVVEYFRPQLNALNDFEPGLSLINLISHTYLSALEANQQTAQGLEAIESLSPLIRANAEVAVVDFLAAVRALTVSGPVREDQLQEISKTSAESLNQAGFTVDLLESAYEVLDLAQTFAELLARTKNSLTSEALKTKTDLNLKEWNIAAAQTLPPANIESLKIPLENYLATLHPWSEKMLGLNSKLLEKVATKYKLEKFDIATDDFAQFHAQLGQIQSEGPWTKQETKVLVQQTLQGLPKLAPFLKVMLGIQESVNQPTSHPLKAKKRIILKVPKRKTKAN